MGGSGRGGDGREIGGGSGGGGGIPTVEHLLSSTDLALRQVKKLRKFELEQASHLKKNRPVYGVLNSNLVSLRTHCLLYILGLVNTEIFTLTVPATAILNVLPYV